MRKSALVAFLFAFLCTGCGYTRHLWTSAPMSHPDGSSVVSFPYFRAAATVLDITPDHNVWLAGYHPGRKSTGVHDSIEARILTLQDTTGHVIAIVTVDMLGFLKSDTDTLRQYIGDPSIDVFVLSSHNHSSPDLIGIYGPTMTRVPLVSGRDEAYIDLSIRRISRAIHESIKSLTPVTVTFARDQPRITVSDVEEPDNDFDVWRFESIESRNTVAVLVVAGCHPTTLIKSSTLMTSDFPGVMRDILDTELRTKTLFINSAPGGVTYDPVSRKHSTFERRADVGKRFAHAALATLASHRSIAPSPFRVHRKEIELPITNPLFLLGGILGYIPNDGWFSRTTEISTLTIGDVTIVTTPGEIFPSLSREIKAMSPGTVEIWSLANDEIGYIFRKEDFDNPAFKYWRGVSLGPETGPLIIRHTHDILNAAHF